MNNHAIILNLLNKFSEDHKNISWKIKCSFSDGMGTTINQIKIIALPENRVIGVFAYTVETGLVLFCKYKKLKKTKSENIIDLLLDMLNYSKGQTII